METYSYSKLTEYFSDYIAYRPELKKYFGKTTTAILVNQLERFFAIKPTIFYKFLAPCDHKLYRKNDSWVENLAFTESEFRSAFDKVGVRYRSKTQLMKYLESDNNNSQHQTASQKPDPFQGKLYLSYLDVKQNITFYVRNDRYAEECFEAIIAGFEPNSPIAYMDTDLSQEEVEQVEKERQSLIKTIQANQKIVVETSDLENCTSGDKESSAPEIKKCISRDEETQSLEIKKYSSRDEETSSPYNEHKQPTKTTTNTTNNLTSSQSKAVAQKDKIQIPEQVGSVDIYKNSFEVEVGSELTPQQEIWVEQQFQVLLKNPAIKISSPDTLLAEIKFCLCDKAAFTQCEEQLPRKFAAIKTMIETGRWRTPFGMLAKARKIEEGADSAQQEKLAHIKAQLNEVKAQRNTLQRVQDSDKNYLETLKAITDEAMRRDAEQTAKCQMQKRQEAIIALTEDELRLTNELHIFEKRGSNTGVTT